MNRRHACLVALAAIAAFAAGCSGAPSEQTADVDLASSTSALSNELDIQGNAIALTSIDYATSTITGLNKKGEVVTATLTTDTTFRAANLHRFIPGDPCHDPAADYNAVLGSVDFSVDNSVTPLVSNNCTAQINIDHKTNAVRWFRPVP